MAHWIGRLSALAIVAGFCGAAAHAATIAKVVCQQLVLSQPVVAQCAQAQTYPSSIPGIEVTGRGEASADLRTGALKSRSVGQAYQTGSDDLVAGGGAIAELQDTITIGGGFSGTVEIRMEVSGSFLMSDPSFPSGAPQMAALLWMWDTVSPGLSGEVAVFVRQYNQPFDVQLVPIAGGGVTGNATLTTNVNPATGNFDDPADIRLVLTTRIVVTPSSPTFTFFARLGTSAAVNSLADTNGEVKTSELDFGNSANLSLIIPAGVPWTSESGAFLQSVPEPGTAALLAAAMLCLTTLRRAIPRARVLAALALRAPRAQGRIE